MEAFSIWLQERGVLKYSTFVEILDRNIFGAKLAKENHIIIHNMNYELDTKRAKICAIYIFYCRLGLCYQVKS